MTIQREQIVDAFLTALYVQAEPGDLTITVRSTVGAPLVPRFRIRLGDRAVPASLEWHTVTGVAVNVWTLAEPVGVTQPAGREVATIFNAAAAKSLVGVLQDGTLVANTIDLDFRGATVTTEDGRAVVHLSGGGGGGGSGGALGGAAAAPAVLPSRIRAAAATFNAANFT